MDRTKSFVKTVSIFVLYLLYTNLISAVLGLFGLTDNALIGFVADMLFLLVILFVYNKDLLTSIKDFFNNKNWVTKLGVVIKFVLITSIVNIIYGIIAENIFSSVDTTDANTLAIYAFADTSTLYTIFKILIFAPIAEELIFKKSIREVITNNTLFVVVSGVLYAFMNIIYTDISAVSIITFIRCFISSSILSYAYIKNNDNIFIVMLVKFCYNLIPLTLLLLGV